MSEHDSDIEFDFFDDLETDESPPHLIVPLAASARARRPKRPPERRGLPPALRVSRA